MKRVVLMALVAALAVGTVWSQDKKVSVSLNAGVQTNVWSESSFDKAVFTLDARVGIALGRSFEISPEVLSVFNYTSYFGLSGGTLLYPGVMLNYRPGRLFVGLGLTLPWAFYEGENDSGSLAPKFNIGYSFGNIQMTAYLITWTEEGMDFLDANWVGLTLGYRF